MSRPVCCTELFRQKVFDPLAATHVNLLSTTTFDPLLGEYQVRGVSTGKFENKEPEVDDYPDWGLKKADVLAKYTTNKTIPVPSFVQGVKPVCTSLTLKPHLQPQLTSLLTE